MDGKDLHGVVKRHVFGIRAEVKSCVQWLDDNTLLYPAGALLTLHNLNSNNQRFIESTYQCTGITAVAVSANKKFIAFAESGENPQVQIIDVVTRKRRKVLSVADVGSDRFVSLAFSADGRHLVTQGGAPEWNMYYWNWERSKPLAIVPLASMRSMAEVGAGTTAAEDLTSQLVSTSFSRHVRSANGSGEQLVTAVSVCPSDPLLVTVSGIGMMRYYRYTDGVLQPQSAVGYGRETQDMFITHRWVTGDCVVASTHRGDMIVISKGHFVGTLHTGEETSSNTTYAGEMPPVVLCVEPSKNGFVTGTDRGTVCIYERDDDRPTGFRQICTLQAPTREPEQLDEGGPGEIENNNNNNNESVKEVAEADPTETSVSKSNTVQGLFRVTNRALMATNRGGAASLRNNTDRKDGTVTGGGRTRNDATNDEPLSAVIPNGIGSIALDQLEQNLAIVTLSGRIYGVDFKRDWYSATVSGAANSIPFNPICQMAHTGRINGLSCSVRKPFLMSSSSDHSVRLWNTQTRKLEQCTFFKQEPGALSVHPSGLMAVICFPDKVRVMSILWNSLRERKVINFRNGHSVQFSNGGQYFAISHGNLVDIFNSATLENLGQLRGHPQRVSDFKWCSNSPYPMDDRLITCSPDGMIMDWSSADLRKEAEHSDKRFQYSCIASDDKTLWVVGAPTSAAAVEANYRVTLREIDRHSLSTLGGPSEDFHFTDTSLTCLDVATHQRLLLAGGEDGSLKLMTFPLQAGVQEAPLPAHGGRMTQLCISFDENTLYTSGADGTIIMWDIVSDDAGNQSADPIRSSDEVLVTQNELDDKQLELEVLQQQIDRLKNEIDGDEKRKSHEQRGRIREKEAEFQNDAAVRNEQYASLWNAKSAQERSFVAMKLEKEAEANQEVEMMEREYQAEVEELDGECRQMQETLDREVNEHAQKLESLRQQKKKELEEEEARFQDVLTQRNETLAKLKRQVERSAQTNKETLHQLELDTDAESQEVAGTHQAELNALRERYLHMKGEGAIMRKNTTRMEKEIEIRTNEIQFLDKAKSALSAQLVELGQRMTQLHQDIDERDGVIGEREKEIYNLKKQNQELEKHKFVLDHRIRQLKAQMEPKQREIAAQNQKIKQKEKELEEFYNNNQILRENIDELQEDISQQQHTAKQLQSKIKDGETYMIRAQKDITELAPVVQEPAKLRGVIKELYDKHVGVRGGARMEQADPNVRQEFNAQLEYLSTSVDALRKKVKSDQERHRKEASAMMEENLGLIREIHSLRQTIQQLRTKIASDEAAKRSRSGARVGTFKKKKGGTMTSTKGGSAGSSRRRASSAGAGGYDEEVDGDGNNNNNNEPGRTTSAGPTFTGVDDDDGTNKRQPPKILEANRTNIRMQRAYIEAMQRSLAEYGSNVKLPSIKK